MNFKIANIICGLLVLHFVSGCSLFAPEEKGKKRNAKKLLSPFVAGEKQVSLEVYFVHVDQADKKTIDDVWKYLDEQQLDHKQRNRLADQGFRIGTTSTQLPEAFQALISQGRQTAPGAEVSEGSGIWKAQTYMQKLQVQPNEHSEITTSAIKPEMVVINRAKADISGKSFYNVKAVFNVRTKALGDGQVKLRLIPELQHGENRQRYLGRDGVLWADFGQEKKIFDDLEIAMTLAPGQVLLIGMTNEHHGVGRHFLTYDNAGKHYQKFLAIRLVESKYDDAVSHTVEVPEPLELDEVKDAINDREQLPPQ